MTERIITVTPEIQKRGWLRNLKFIALWILSALVTNARLIGYVGELRVHNSLLKGLPSGSLILSDVMLPTPEGTAQVDLVAVVGNRVFSVEVKNRVGQISGQERDRMWKWRVDRRKGTFYNPVSQSRRHAKYLGELLDQTVVPMVVFAGSARVDSNASCVFDSPRRLMPAILAACSGDVDDSDLASMSQRVAQRLEDARLQGTVKEKRQHIQYAQQVATEKKHRAQEWHRRNSKL